ncbi:hypothetical protein VPHK24_0088 [Vibrio phage K24]|nr:hypothetical protein SIPHO078v2_p0073 [Vibrio phage 14E30.1]QZI92517.1 hypothetical protein SIPHO058v2_p0069 [Vibrio phage 14E30.2]
MHDMIEVSQYIDEMVNAGKGRTESVNYLAAKLKIGVPTLYRWIKSGDHFICDGDCEGSLFSAYKLVSCQEV